MKHNPSATLNSDRMFVLANEMPEKWARMLEIWTAKLQPRDEAEMQIVTEAAFARWRMQRGWSVETALFDLEMDNQAADLAETFDAIDEGIRQASAFKGLADGSTALDQIRRDETRHRRSFEKALATLSHLVANTSAANCAQPQKQILPNELRGGRR